MARFTSHWKRQGSDKKISSGDKESASCLISKELLENPSMFQVIHTKLFATGVAPVKTGLSEQFSLKEEKRIQNGKKVQKLQAKSLAWENWKRQWEGLVEDLLLWESVGEEEEILQNEKV